MHFELNRNLPKSCHRTTKIMMWPSLSKVIRRNLILISTERPLTQEKNQQALARVKQKCSGMGGSKMLFKTQKSNKAKDVTVIQN